MLLSPCKMVMLQSWQSSYQPNYKTGKCDCCFASSTACSLLRHALSMAVCRASTAGGCTRSTYTCSVCTKWCLCTCRRCVDAAAPGCLALIQRHNQPHLTPLPAAAAQQLITRFLTVHVQGLVYKGRLTCYQLLLEVMQVGVWDLRVVKGLHAVETSSMYIEIARCFDTARQQ